MMGLRDYPDTICPALDAGKGHYIYPYVSRWPEPAQGYCYECGQVCHFITYRLSHCSTTNIWTAYHYPIREWP